MEDRFSRQILARIKGFLLYRFPVPHDYCIYSNKRRGANLIFRATSAALI